MSYTAESLGKGERIMAVGRVSLFKKGGWNLIGLILFAVAAAMLLGHAKTVLYTTWVIDVIPFDLGENIGIPFVASAVFAAGVFCWIPAMWVSASTEFAITNNRVVIQLGMFTRATREIQLTKIESISLHQTAWGRVFKYGAIEISGSGSTHARITFLKRPVELRKALEEAMADIGRDLAPLPLPDPEPGTKPKVARPIR